MTLFRVCQEGLNNIVKHADASAVTLQGWQQDERLMLVIEDDGSGLPPGSGQQGFGLTGMRERVTALGGTLHISCLHGTRVSVSLPQRRRWVAHYTFPVCTARVSAFLYLNAMSKV